tara:strand:- start:546 stop:800 length:255 start_codon:yes stop_codon:yes gene_type:complete
MLYYYADAYTDPDSGQIDPQQIGPGGPYAADPPLGTSALLLDREREPFRFVLQVPDNGTSVPPSWELKTAEEVNADYPGTIGGE